MSLTLADLQAWDPEQVLEVAEAAAARARTSREAAKELLNLSTFPGWGGRSAETAQGALTRTHTKIDLSASDAFRVAIGAGHAYQDALAVKQELNAIFAEANEQAPVGIDTATNTVIPPDTSNLDSDAAEAVQAKAAALQNRITALLGKAEETDADLARVLAVATGEQLADGEPQTRAPADQRTPTERASDDNEKRLHDERAKLQAHIDQLQAQYDQLAAKAANDYNNGIFDSDTATQLAGLDDQLSAAKGRLGELDAVDQALRSVPDTYLTQLKIPDDPHQQVLAAVAVGNPDTAANVSVTVPGVGSTTGGTLPGMVKEASNLRDEEVRQLIAAGKPASVSTIAWMGYTPPPNPLNTGSPQDLWQTMTDGTAKAGAADLSQYLEQVRANNPTGHLTVLGHSYGSLTASLALQDLNAHGAHPVNDVVFYGSPGLDLYSPAQLGLDHGQAYVMQAPHDPITNLVAPLAPVHGWGLDPYGPGSGMTELSSQAGVDATGVWRDGAYGHADYPRTFIDANGNPQLCMSGYNLAAVAAGLPENEVTAPLLPPSVGGGMTGAPRHVPMGGK